MKPSPPHRVRRGEWRYAVHRVMGALGGEATLGDVVTITGLTREAVQDALDALLSEGFAHVRVSESGDVAYYLSADREGEREATPVPVEPRWERGVSFDRKTLQLIRAREGVISIAELVEHTGLTVEGARTEMRRLADRYGGVPHVSLDGHVVHAFPEVMMSAHGRFGTREPRPAWVRSYDILRAARAGRLSRLFGSLLERLPKPARVAIGRRATVRRYLLGLVIQTALAGKGVVSIGRAVQYVSSRAGRQQVRRRVVEKALRQLAAEFEAPVTRIHGDVCFGFRSVKRQFLASHILRRELHLARTASGDTIFDTADPPLVAAERELSAFDLALSAGKQAVPPDPTRPATTAANIT